MLSRSNSFESETYAIQLDNNNINIYTFGYIYLDTTEQNGKEPNNRNLKTGNICVAIECIFGCLKCFTAFSMVEYRKQLAIFPTYICFHPFYNRAWASYSLHFTYRIAKLLKMQSQPIQTSQCVITIQTNLYNTPNTNKIPYLEIQKLQQQKQ